MNWIVHLALAALQALAAWPLAQLYGAPGIVGPLLVCALIFPLYPVAFGRISLLHRAGRMDQVGRVMGLTVSVGNLLTAALALLGFELWSVAIPRVVSAALWVVMARRLGPEPPAPGPDERADWRAIWRYGKSILGAELLKTARLQGDKLIVGKVLGLEALGVYAFAFNAGLGLSQSLLTGFSNALFPHLCAAGRGGDMLRAAGQAMRGALAAAAVLFGAQAILAPWYVPLAFGARWEPAVAPLAILCLSAITRPLWESASQLLRAAGAPQAELGWSLAVTGVLFAAVALGASLGGVIGAATAYFIVHVIADPSFAAWAFGRIRRAPALVAAE